MYHFISLRTPELRECLKKDTFARVLLSLLDNSLVYV